MSVNGDLLSQYLARWRDSLQRRKTHIIIEALEYITFNVCNCARRDTVSGGYKRTGQYPVDVDKTLSLTTYKYSKEEKETILAAVPQLVQYMRKYGELTESFMDELNIPNLNHLRWSSKDNDTRPLSNQRAVIMNSETCIKKHIDRMKLKELSKSGGENTAPKKRGPKPKTPTNNAMETMGIAPTTAPKPKRAYNKRKIEPVALPEPKQPRLEDCSTSTDNNIENMSAIRDSDDGNKFIGYLFNKGQNIFIRK